MGGSLGLNTINPTNTASFDYDNPVGFNPQLMQDWYGQYVSPLTDQIWGGDYVNRIANSINASLPATYGSSIEDNRYVDRLLQMTAIPHAQAQQGMLQALFPYMQLYTQTQEAHVPFSERLNQLGYLLNAYAHANQNPYTGGTNFHQMPSNFDNASANNAPTAPTAPNTPTLQQQIQDIFNAWQAQSNMNNAMQSGQGIGFGATMPTMPTQSFTSHFTPPNNASAIINNAWANNAGQGIGFGATIPAKSKAPAKSKVPAKAKTQTQAPMQAQMPTYNTAYGPMNSSLPTPFNGRRTGNLYSSPMASNSSQSPTPIRKGSQRTSNRNAW